ncbi:MAG: hypothetical protein AAFR61_28415 [Bacteroidota bacterium]
MKPPICSICRKDFRRDTASGGLVSFKLTEEEAQYNERFKQPGFVGHPKGKHWFCSEHIEAARAHRHLSWQEARPLIKKAGGGFWQAINPFKK